jgi:hypothetical protein
MGLKFNIDRPKVSDDEIKKRQDFQSLVRNFKEQSIKKARGDESWWRNKKIRYTAVIAGITVICTVTYQSLFNDQKQKQVTSHDKISTLKTTSKKVQAAAYVQAPSSKLKGRYSAYSINNSKGGIITHSTSSTIKVPKNTFVDKTGKDVIGDVTIEYIEFHDLGDIVLSGIPMNYDSAGSSFNLESAGMFDIRGSQNGEPVFIKKENPVKIELASSNPDDRFNQYFLDTVKQNWQYLKRDNLHKNVSATNHQASDRKLRTQTIQHLEYKAEKVIPRQADSVRVFYQKQVSALHKPLAPHKPAKATQGRPNFVLEGTYEHFPELSAFSNVLFEVGPENRNYSKELHEITWSDIKITQGPVKGRNYILHLSYRDRKEKLIVYPVLNGADLEKAQEQYEKKLVLYNELADKKAAEEKRLMAEMEAKQSAYLANQQKIRVEIAKERARLKEERIALANSELDNKFNSLNTQNKSVRLFEVTRFGIYNSDCPHTSPGGEVLNPIFVLHNNGQPLLADQVYLVDHIKKTVYMFRGAEQQQMRATENGQYSICVFRSQKLFICDKKSFASTRGSGGNKFKVAEMEDDVSIVEFKRALEL